MKPINDFKIFITRQEVEHILSFSRSTIYAKLDKNSSLYDKNFPQPIKLCENKPRKNLWVKQEIIDYAELCIKRNRG